ncbi:MAG: membrane integrity-associated transporter subunit PqiC [Alphaproteobacteria bacterium]|nr:membrane integrity-associated transporter subunit PqiC [Alphaproteobacteria bacterium]
MKKLFTLIAVVLLGGCLGGFSSPSRFYSLTPQETPARTYQSSRLFVGVEPVKVPVYLDKPQIVTRNANQVELSISENNRWAEPLSDAMQNVLASDLGALLPGATIKPSSFRKEGFDYTVWVEINKFEGTWNRQAELDAWWSILNSDNKIIARDKVSLSRPLGDSYDNLVQQQSALTEELAAQIAARLAKLPK